MLKNFPETAHDGLQTLDPMCMSQLHDFVVNTVGY